MLDEFFVIVVDCDCDCVYFYVYSYSYKEEIDRYCEAAREEDSELGKSRIRDVV